ncbi:hypothetical protein HZC31_04680 [Candidatus Woesearchaeota archaeon]|nr:hypothetical protein [Candidatus Woesearchaeota archaeon]
MKNYFLILSLLFLLFLTSCEDKEDQETKAEVGSLLAQRCGDGVCDAIELKRGICAEDCSLPSSGSSSSDSGSSPSSSSYDMDTYTYEPVSVETAWTTSISSTKISETEDSTRGIITSKYTVINPTTGAELAVVVYAPNDASSSNQYPAVILIPGGIGTKDNFILDAQKYAVNGFIALVFDADGRGESTGEEDYNGYAQQDGLYELYRFLSDFEGVDPDNVGLVSFSYGVTMATGMLGRYQPDMKFYIEWEGPVNRYYTSVGCVSEGHGAVKSGITCDDEEYWVEREALRYVPYLPVDYFVIVQRSEDHVQPTVQHSVDINNLATEYLRWVRVNGLDNAINTEYTVDTLPVLEGTSYKTEILDYMIEIAAE